MRQRALALLSSAHTKPVIALVLVSVFIRVLYGIYQPHLSLTPDSDIYYDLARQLYTNPSVKLVFNPFKSPLYGMFLHMILRATGWLSAPTIKTAEFYAFTQVVLLVQSAIGVAGAAVYYATLVQLGLSRRFIISVSLLHAANMLLIPWERTLLSETSGIFLMILLCYSFVCLLKSFRSRYIMLFILSSLMGLLLRPALVTAPLVLLAVLIIHYRSVQVLTTALFIGTGYLLAVFILVLLNTLNWGYIGLQITGDINLLGKILELHVPVDSARSLAPFADILIEYRRSGQELHPYRLLDSYDPAIYTNFEKLDRLRAFTTTVIRNNAAAYLRGSLALVPKALSDLDPVIAVSGTSPLGSLLRMLEEVYRVVSKSALVTILLLPIALYRLLSGRRSPRESTMTGFGVLGASQILLTVMLVYNEYGRLIAVVVPQLTIFSLYWLLHTYRSFLSSLRH